MTADPHAEAARWIDQAARDLDDGRILEQASRHNTACFLAQQAAEKALKAYLYRQGATLVLGHGVGELCRQAAGQEPGFRSVEQDADGLDKYYVPTRYPNSLPGGTPYRAFQAIDSAAALAAAERIIAFVRSRL